MTRLVVFILNRTEVLNDLLRELSDNGIKGWTIIQSIGMGHELANMEEFSFFGSLRKMLNPDRKENITLLLAIHVEQLEVVTKIINRIVGDLSEPDTGILFSLPIEYIQGLKF